jgi:hypothetical protein
MSDFSLADSVVRIYPCPLPSCPWVLAGDPPGPAESPLALADIFGPGVFAAHALNTRLQRTERELADHLAGHTVQEFAVALAAANKHIAALEHG